MIQVQEADLIIYLHLDHIDGFLDKALKNKDTLVVSEGIQFIE
jgi:ABC-type Zn uptake system ZnuABC Zn-binding protein ZnuA